MFRQIVATGTQRQRRRKAPKLELIGPGVGGFCSPAPPHCGSIRVNAMLDGLCCGQTASVLYRVRVAPQGWRRERFVSMCPDCAVRVGLVW